MFIQHIVRNAIETLKIIMIKCFKPTRCWTIGYHYSDLISTYKIQLDERLYKQKGLKKRQRKFIILAQCKAGKWQHKWSSLGSWNLKLQIMALNCCFLFTFFFLVGTGLAFVSLFFYTDVHLEFSFSSCWLGVVIVNVLIYWNNSLWFGLHRTLEIVE